MTTIRARSENRPGVGRWLALAAAAAVAGAAAVVLVQAIALAIRPDIALFRPLDSYARSALFTMIPAFAATALLAWLAARRADPVGAFLRIAAVVLVLSFIPDYILPVPHRTLLASTVTALLHVVAALVITGILVGGYRRFSREQ